MALDFDSDLSSILNTKEYATTISPASDGILLESGDYLLTESGDRIVRATSTGSPFSGIFDNATVPVDAGGNVVVHQEQPRLTCRTTDLSWLSEGSVMTIAGVEYKAQAWIEDGTGVTEVQLEKQ